jgi:hypothetical protein
MTFCLSVCLALGALAMAPTPVALGHHPARYTNLEHFGLSLTNCLRTGGYVTRRGNCRGRGSGRYSTYRRPLEFSTRIARRVARPYASKLARADACRHDLYGSSIDGRFASAGLRAYKGESIGCSGGYTTRQMVVRTIRMFQAEKSYNGWHWRNLKNPDFRRVGVGIARSGRESRVVYDFYSR